jgi:hypothetical protein
VHHVAIAHLLRHLRCNTRTAGVTYCSDLSTAPVTQLLASIGAPTDFPLVMFTHSSCQDCPDTSHSTGCYLIYWKIRGFVENEPSPNVFTSFAPSFDRWSEAGARRPHSYEFAQRMPSLEFSRGETN